MVKQLLSFVLVAFCLPLGVSSAQNTIAPQAIVIDVNTQTTLFEKNADDRMAPSSMTKILTAYVVVNEIKAGRIALNDKFTVTREAFRRGGSTMFLEQTQRVSVLDLLQGMIIVSGNDAAITLATGISGSQEEFMILMNETAKAIGMWNSNFVNASGWPEDDHYSTARDIAIVSMRFISDHPDFYSIFSERQFRFNRKEQPNGNPILSHTFPSLPEGFLMADGIKTGTTKAGGHGFAGSAVDRSGRRVVTVLNGMATKRQRSIESKKIMEWAFTEFQNYQLFNAGQVVGYAPVWLGLEEQVSLHVTKSIRMALPATTFANMEATLIFDSPLEAPVYIDQQVGFVQLAGPGIDPIFIPVVAGKSVDSVGRFQQVLTGLQFSVLGVEN